MNENPLITVNILSFNRKDELRNTLNKVYEQDYKNIEVIVVDNASSDGSPEMVEREFPSVHLIKLKKNIGIAGWNEGFKIAKGEYILVLDDDSYPEKNAVKIAVKRFCGNPHTGIVALNIFNSCLKSFENKEWNRGYINNFTGCGALISKKLIEKTGGFEQNLFIYAHEIEFAMRAIDLDYSIYFEPNALAVHSYADSKEKHSRNEKKEYYFLRNNLVIILLHFSLPIALSRIFRIVLGRILFSIINLKFYPNISAIYSMLLILPSILRKRHALKKQTQESYDNGGFAGGFFNNRKYSFKRPQWLKQK